MLSNTRRLAATTIAGALIVGGGFTLAQARQQQEGGPDMGQILAQGLMSTEGCLGVEFAQTSSGKNSIIAWFDDAEAARRWYFSETHQRVMAGMGGSDRKPLEHAPEGVPLMVMATITPSQDQKIEGFPFPISQISIEIFQPVPGGAYVNGRLSPDSFAVPHIRNLTLPAN